MTSEARQSIAQNIAELARAERAERTLKALLRSSEWHKAERYLAKLSLEDQIMIKVLFGIDGYEKLTQKAYGHTCGCSHSRIQQRKDAAFRLMAREYLDSITFDASLVSDPLEWIV